MFRVPQGCLSRDEGLELSYGFGASGLRVASKDVKYDFESSLSMNVKAKAKDKKL